MANYHLEITAISRGKGNSIARLVNYISGERVRDNYLYTTYYRKRDDVVYCRIFQQPNAPADYYDLQGLCDNFEKAEKRYDARTGRELKCSLPNELPLREQIAIVEDFINTNLISCGLCAIAAIHEGRNPEEPERNNPHVHIIVSTRAVGPNGFSKKKDREHNKRSYTKLWREQWASVQNRAYERNRLDIRVSHESLEVQGIVDRKPVKYISRIDWQKEKLGGRTPDGDERRKIKERNKERKRSRHKREPDRERSR